MAEWSVVVDGQHMRALQAKVWSDLVTCFRPVKVKFQVQEKDWSKVTNLRPPSVKLRTAMGPYELQDAMVNGVEESKGKVMVRLSGSHLKPLEK